MKSFLSFNKLLAVAVMLSGGSLFFQSCLDDDDNYYYGLWQPNALVTVKPVVDDSFFMQLDDSTTLLPVNVKKSPYGDKEVRALVNYEEVNQPSGEYTKAVHLNRIDSILTKPIAQDLGDKNDEVYGTDPVEILKDWVTIAEDGYLTLSFRTRWGNAGERHFLNLLMSQDPAHPYEVEFRHNAFGDIYGKTGDALVAFNLSSLPDTKGKTVKLKLKWKSFSGEKSTEFDYCTRKPNAGSPVIPSDMKMGRLQ